MHTQLHLKIVPPLRLILLLATVTVLAVGLAACSDDPRVFDPHVGTWRGTAVAAAQDADSFDIEMTVIPGGVLTITHASTGATYDYSYWARFEQEGDDWQLGIGVYPMGGQREQRFLMMGQSSDAPDTLLLETDEVGAELLGFAHATLQRVP